METDRAAVFVTEAAARGLLDFREAKLQETMWQRKVNLTRGYLARQRDKEIYDAQFRLNLALLSNSGLTKDSFENVQSRANELRDNLEDTVRPWAREAREERKKEEFKSHRQKYIDAFGVDPTDKDFQTWEAETIESLYAEEEGMMESEEQRVSRLIIERQQRGRALDA